MRKRKQKKKFKASRYDKLVVDLRNNLTTRISDLISRLLNSVQDKLFDMAETAANNEDHNRYFELMNQIRSLKSGLAETYLNEIKKSLVPASKYSAKHKIENNGPDELSLIDQDEMEGMVLVKSIGGHATAQYSEQLSHLEARLEQLASKTETVFDSEAITPTSFCQIFDDTLGDHFDNLNKKILFYMFQTEVANKLESLYDSLNNRLIDADILPQIKLNIHGEQHKHHQSGDQLAEQQPGEIPSTGEQPETPFLEGGNGGSIPGVSHTGAPPSGTTTLDITGGSVPAGTNIIANRQTTGAANTGNRAGGTFATNATSSNVAPGGFAMTATPGDNYRHHQPGSFSSGVQNNRPSATEEPATNTPGTSFSGQSSVNASTDNAQNSTAASINNNNFQHYTAGIPARQVGQVLGDFLGTPINQQTLPHGTPEPGSPVFPAGSTNYFGHQEIIQALSGLQTQPQFIQSEEPRFDAEVIKQAVVNELSKVTGGVITKGLNQIAEKTIDFIELIFDAIIDDEEISDTIKTLLLRLQIPVIKASMSDPEFFIYDDHAARVLLDRIAEAGVGVNEHTDDMYIHLDGIVSTILTEYDLSIEIFQNALDKLDKIIEKQMEIASKEEQQAQQKTLRNHARTTVLKALRVVTSGKILPEAVHPLILKRWPTLMFNHYLQYGKENDEWVTLVETLRDIIDSVQPLIAPEDLAILLADKDEILTAVRDYLADTVKSEKDINEVLDGLIKTYELHIQDATFSDQEVQQAEETIEEMEEEPDDLKEKLSRHEPLPEIPSYLIPGTWFQLYMGEDQLARRCKLSVIVPEDANLIFVNHKGEIIVEKSFDEFNAEIATNKTKVIMEHSIFDNALRSVITRLDHQ